MPREMNRSLVSLVGPMMCGVMALCGCSSSSATGSTSTSGDAGSAAPQTPDTTGCPDAGVGCNTLGVGDLIRPQCQTSAAPDATGGSIVEGSYVLTAISQYGADCGLNPAGTRAGASYRAGKLDLVTLNESVCQTASLDWQQRQTWSVTTGGTKLSGSESCDSAFSVPSGTNTWTYSATASTLSLATQRTSSDSLTVMTYTLTP